MFGPFFDLKYFLDSFLVENITTYPVHCIGGITDNGSISDFFCNLSYITRLRIIWIYRNLHSFSIYLLCLQTKMRLI